MIDLKIIGIFMIILVMVSFQYSLNVIIRLLKETVELLHLISMKNK